MENYYEVEYETGWSLKYDTYEDAIDAITKVINTSQEVATSITEYENGEPSIRYKPEYSAKLVWTEILNKDSIL